MSEGWDNEVGIPSSVGGRELRTASGRKETCNLLQGTIMVIITISNNKSKTPKALSRDAMAGWDLSMQIVRSCGSRACLEVALSDNLLLAEKTVARIKVSGGPVSRGEGAGEGSWVKLVLSPKPLPEGDAQCFVFEYAISVHCLLKEGSFGTPSVEGTVCALTSASRHSFIRRN